MISISKPELKVKDNKSYLVANVTIKNSIAIKWMEFSSKASNDFSYIQDEYPQWIKENNTLWFSVENDFKEGICSDRADAFVVAMLYYAMAVGEDIYSDTPVSSQLLFNLNNHLIPSLCKKNKGYKLIKIHAPSISTPCNTKKFVGTGMSSGVDSFHALYKYSSKNIDENFRLTHLTFFNVGADRNIDYKKSNMSIEDMNTTTSLSRENKISRGKMISKKAGLGYLVIDSNISDIYQGMFERSHIYRSCSAVLVVQKFFKVYYLASTGLPIDDYIPDLTQDPGHYEQLLLSCLSNGNVTFISGSKPYDRMEKMSDLRNFALAHEFLNVCSQDYHCGKCTKCYRTFINIEILDSVDLFSNVISSELIKASRSKAYFWLLKNRNINKAAALLWPEAKMKKLIPFESYINYILYELLQPPKKLLRKPYRYIKNM